MSSGSVPPAPAPPPPPPPIGIIAQKTVKPTKPAIKPRVKMRTLYWNRIILDHEEENKDKDGERLDGITFYINFKSQRKDSPIPIRRWVLFCFNIKFYVTWCKIRPPLYISPNISVARPSFRIWKGGLAIKIFSEMFKRGLVFCFMHSNLYEPKEPKYLPPFTRNFLNKTQGLKNCYSTSYIIFTLNRKRREGEGERKRKDILAFCERT